MTNNHYTGLHACVEHFREEVEAVKTFTIKSLPYPMASYYLSIQSSTTCSSLALPTLYKAQRDTVKLRGVRSKDKNPVQCSECIDDADRWRGKRRNTSLVP